GEPWSLHRRGADTLVGPGVERDPIDVALRDRRQERPHVGEARRIPAAGRRTRLRPHDGPLAGVEGGEGEELPLVRVVNRDRVEAGPDDAPSDTGPDRSATNLQPNC